MTMRLTTGKKQLPLLLLVLMTFASWAQNNPTAALQQDFKKIFRAYQKDTNDVAVLLALSNYYASPDNASPDYPLAMKLSLRADSLFAEVLQDVRRDNITRSLMRKGINVTYLREYKQRLESQALTYYKTHDTISPSVQEAFMKYYSHIPEIVSLTNARRMESAYALATQENSIQGYLDFIDQYSGTDEAEACESAMLLLLNRLLSAQDNETSIDSVAALYSQYDAVMRSAVRQKSRIAYSRAARINTVQSYTDYLQKYPTGDCYAEALERLQALQALQFGSLKTAQEYAAFATENDDLPLAETAIERLRQRIIKDHDVEAAQVYLSHFPLDQMYSTIFRTYYSWFSAEGNRSPIADFAERYPDYPFNLTVESDLAHGIDVDVIDLMKPYNESEFANYSSYIYKLTGKKSAFVALQRILQQQLQRQDWKGAKSRIDNFGLSFETESKEEYEALSRLIAAAPNKAYQRHLELSDLKGLSRAVVSPDGQHLYYSTSVQGITRLYCSETSNQKNVKWATGRQVRVLQAPATAGIEVYNFYQQGRRVLLGIEGDIWTARVESDTLWTLEGRLPAPVNSKYHECDAFMLHDESGILLASDRPNGHNLQKSGVYFHGDTALALDLYFVPRIGQEWSEPINLGFGVNTPYCDHSPVLSHDMTTLYYITDGHAGLGYGDIYKVTREDVNDWSHWSTPVNLGKETNTCFAESSLSMADDQARLYFVSVNGRQQSSAVQSTVARHDSDNALCHVNLDLREIRNRLQSVAIADLSQQFIINNYEIGQIDTVIQLEVLKGKNYVVYLKTDTLFAPPLFIDAKAKERIFPQAFDMVHLLDMKYPLALPSVRFESESARMLPLAEQDMALVIKYMEFHPEVAVELVVHVPGTNDEHCFDLSQERSKALRSYLVQEGISISRIRLSGYGNVPCESTSVPSQVFVRFFVR